VAKCIDKTASEIAHVTKLAEGGFNRVLQFDLRDGTTLLARLPYPTTQPKHFAVASEVATLDLVRQHGLPVPKVLKYAASTSNPFGAEYIIMEKIPGRPLGDAWFRLDETQRLKVIKQVVSLEAKLFDIDLPAYGSIYKKHDLAADVPRVTIPSPDGSDEFCMGPDASLRWWHMQREQLAIDRGPCE
jgi:hypothetical protein